MQQRIESLRDLRELHPLSLEDLAQERVAVDVLALVRVLKPVSGEDQKVLQSVPCIANH